MAVAAGSPEPDAGLSRFRPDVEGLRAVAIAVVVLFHIGFPWIAGGYVGVDVFFVISGFLICGHLLRSAEATDGGGRIRLASFWARRMRRLAPALLVVVALTLVAGVVVYSPLAWTALGRDAAWSAAYLSNFHFASTGGGYFVTADSPLLHTWSLSIEEQFYVAWPLALVVALAIATRSTRRSIAPLTVATIVLVGGFAVSFALGVLFTRRDSPWAYLAPWTRAWEFAAGGLLAMWAARRTRADRPDTLPRPAADLVGILGLALIVGSALRFDTVTPFPGFAALVPVVGTLAVVIAGEGALAARCLSLRPIRYVGRISYSWYLWHWPVIVLVLALYGRASLTVASVAAAASFGLAALSYPLVERRGLRAQVLQRSRTTLVAAALGSSALIGAGLAAGRIANERIAGDPHLAQLAAIREGRQTTGSTACRSEPVADGLDTCVYGPADARHRVLLIGDSHAAQWSPVFEKLAMTDGFELVVSTRGGCAATGIDVRRTGRDSASPECAALRSRTSRIIDGWQPDLVVVTQADYTDRLLAGPGGPVLSPAAARARTVEAARSFGADLTARGVPFVVIGDNPAIGGDPLECLARHGVDSRCSATATSVLPGFDELWLPQAQAFRESGALEVFDTAARVCDAQWCYAERDGIVQYADGNHLSKPFVLAQEAAMGEFLRVALARTGD